MSVGAIQSFPLVPVWEDPLDILPRRRPQDFTRDQTIYTPEDPAHTLFLVVSGMVRVSRISRSGRETVLDCRGPDRFFGESCLLAEPYRGEMAVAQEDTLLMEWSASDLHEIMMRSPALGPSLLRMVASKLRDMEDRVESLATDQIPQRLVKVIMRLGEAFGEPSKGTQVHLMPITHELLAKHVGTSREIITQHMSRLRRDGLLAYSRAGMDFDPAALRRALLEN